MKILKKMIGNAEAIIAVCFLTAMLGILTYNTIFRYVFRTTLPWAEEMCAYGLVWLVYIAVSYGVKEHAHICIDSVLGIYPRKIKGLLMLLGYLAWFAFAIIMTRVSFGYMMDALQKGGRAISVAVPLWMVYLSIPMGHVLLSIRLLQQIVICIKCILKGIDPATVLVASSVEGIELGVAVDEDAENKDGNHSKGGAL